MTDTLQRLRKGTSQDFAAALVALSQDDLSRLRAIARLHAQSLPSGMSWSDLLQIEAGQI
jgi:hypothetical protein